MIFQGQNRKHLEINARANGNANDHQLCFFTVRAGLKKCPYQSECKHSHDLTSYLARRLADLGTNCYMFETYGQCFYGILCRFGQSHIDPVTGENRIDLTGRLPYTESLNKYPPLLKHYLRRKKYNFTLSDKLVRTANKEITKANIVKRNQPVEEQAENTTESTTEAAAAAKNEDRSLADIYYSALTTQPEETEKLPVQVRF